MALAGRGVLRDADEERLPAALADVVAAEGRDQPFVAEAEKRPSGLAVAELEQHARALPLRMPTVLEAGPDDALVRLRLVDPHHDPLVEPPEAEGHLTALPGVAVDERRPPARKAFVRRQREKDMRRRGVDR